MQDIRALSGIARTDQSRASWAAEQQRHVTAFRMNNLMKELAYTLVHLRHEHNKMMTGHLFLQFCAQPQGRSSPSILPEVPSLLQEYHRKSQRINLQPMFLSIGETQGSRFFFNTQLVVCEECYERCMFSDSAVPCAASATHVVTNEVAIMRSIEAHFERVGCAAVDTSAPALPTTLLNVFDGAVESMRHRDYDTRAKHASNKLKFAKAAVESMLELLTSRHSCLRDRVLEGAFHGFLRAEREDVAHRAELLLDLKQNLVSRVQNGWLKLSPSDRDSLLFAPNTTVTLSQGRDAIEYVQNSVREKLERLKKHQQPDKIFKDCSWLRCAFPSDAQLWTESTCTRALQDIECQADEIGGILEFFRMAAEVQNREDELLELRRQLQAEYNDVESRAREARVRAQSMPREATSAAAAALVEREQCAESKCAQLLHNQKFRVLLSRNTQADNSNLRCDSCSGDLPRDWVLLRCCHHFCPSCWNAHSQTAVRSCLRCHVPVLHHDVFETCRRKVGAELGCYELSHWIGGHPLNRMHTDESQIDDRQLIRSVAHSPLASSPAPPPHTVQSSPQVNAIPLKPSGSDSGTRLAVCIRRILCISEQSSCADKVVIASFAFGSSVASSPLKEALVNALKQENIAAVCVSGTQVEQAEAIRRFDDEPDIRVLLLDMRSSYSGVTLTAANHLVLLDPFLHLPETQQIIARISRQGQRKPCFVYHMCAAGTVEEAILVKRERPASELQLPLVQVNHAARLPTGAAVEAVAQGGPEPAVPSAACAAAAQPLAAGAEGGAAASIHDAAKRPRSLSEGASSAPSVTSPVPAPAALPPAAASPLSPQQAAAKTFALQLRDAGLCFDDAALDRLVALGGEKGVCDMDDLRGLNEAEVRASVEHMLLTPVQLNKLLKRLGVLGGGEPSKVPRLE